MADKKPKNENQKENEQKLKYQKPEIITEEVLGASLGATCNGMAGGSRKADAPSGCSILKT